MKIDNRMSEEELALAEARMTEAKNIIEAASLQLMRYRPFFGVLIASMPVIPATRWLNTAATDGRNIYFSPEFIAGMTPERRALVDTRADATILDPAKRAEMKEYLDVFYRPKTTREVIFIIEHEIRHVVGEHAYRAMGYNPSNFNIAADHFINIDTVMSHSKSIAGMGTKAWFPLGNKTVFEKDKEFGFMCYGYCDFQYEGLYTEQIYDILFPPVGSKPQKPKPKPGSGGKPGQSGMPGAGEPGEKDEEEGNQPSEGLKGADAHQNNSGGIGSDDRGRHTDEGGDGGLGMGDVDDILGLDPHSQPRQSKSEKNSNDAVMRRAIQNAVKAAGGDAPAEARKFVEELGQPKINYIRILKRTLERWFKEDLSFRRLSKRSHSMTRSLRQGGYITNRQSVIFPSRAKGKTIRAGVFFDVSGSFTDDLLRPTMREIRGLCNQYKEFEVLLACWSTRIGNTKWYNSKNIREISDFKIETTYGTDVSCVFEYLDKMKDPVDQPVVFTDGYFSDVSKVKDWSTKYKDTLWVVLGRSNDWKPPFGKAIMFDKYIK